MTPHTIMSLFCKMKDASWILIGLFFSGIMFNPVNMTFASFGDFNPTLIRPRNSSHPYCSYFQNRMPSPALELRNCSKYRQESCCRQVELDAIFKSIKPIPGADTTCQSMLNYMICWICNPKQNSFYSSSKQKLTFCESLCDKILDACKSAIFKGEEMGKSYADGRAFCLDHNFNVSSQADDRCFAFHPEYLSEINSSRLVKASVQNSFIVILLLSAVHYFLLQPF